MASGVDIGPFQTIVNVGWTKRLYMIVSMLFEGRSSASTFLELAGLGIQDGDGSDFANAIFATINEGSVEKDNDGGREGTLTDLRPAKWEPEGVGAVTQAGSGPGGQLVGTPDDGPHFYVDGAFLVVDSPEGTDDSEILDNPALEPDPDAYPPWEWRQDSEIGTLVDMWYPDGSIIATTGGVVHYPRSNPVGGGENDWKITIFRKHFDAYDYRYYPAFYWRAVQVDMVKLWQLLGSIYYKPNDKPVDIGVWAALDEGQVGADQPFHVRWQVYNGKPDAAGSAASNIQAGGLAGDGETFDPDTVTWPEIWTFLLQEDDPTFVDFDEKTLSGEENDDYALFTIIRWEFRTEDAPSFIDP